MKKRFILLASVSLFLTTYNGEDIRVMNDFNDSMSDSASTDDFTYREFVDEKEQSPSDASDSQALTETEKENVIMGLSDDSETPIEKDVEQDMAVLVDEQPERSSPAVMPKDNQQAEQSSEVEDSDFVEQEQAEDDDIVRGPQKAVSENEAIAVEDLTFNIAAKEKAVIELVNKAVVELQDKPLDVACNRFSHTKEFINGELYIFVYDTQGICFAHGDDSHLIWKNLYNLRDSLGTFLIQEIIKKAKAGGGWVTYGWHNSTKVAYSRLVEKEGKTYVVGSGYYPHSKEEAVVNLVKAGVELFNQTKTNGQPVEWAFSRMSYPHGQFVSGNLYLYALDFKGTIVAQGERPGLINSNAWDYRDENGLYVNREIVKKLQTTTQGVWVEYISKRASKKAYAEKVTAKNGKKYFIACGYYPDADRERTVDLVRKGYQFMKIHGKTNSVERFSQRRSDDFRYGDLFLTVYDLKGRIIADGGNADNIGRVVIDKKDEDGFEYIRSMLRRVTREGVWVNSKIRGSFKSTFAIRIDIGVGQYVIAASYYPVSKAETMVLLVESAVSFLKSHTRAAAFEQFVMADGKFRRGDLELVVVDMSGLCYTYGNDFDLIWRNIFNIQDQKGRQFIKLFINESEHGDTVIKTNLNNATKVNYVSSAEKDGKTYVISSGYYE